jgi:hypothetical protein
MAAAISMECGDFLEFQVIFTMFNLEMKVYGVNFTTKLCYSGI